MRLVATMYLKGVRLTFDFRCVPYAPSYCIQKQSIIPHRAVSRAGGLSPELASMDQIKRIMRPTDVPDTGLLCDLLWSDPDKDIVGWGENDRGVSFTFGPDVVAAFLKRHDLDLICRAHQVVEDGYEFFAKRQLVTLFSAPNYWCVQIFRFRSSHTPRPCCDCTSSRRSNCFPTVAAQRRLLSLPPTCDRVQRRVRQRWCHDERRRHAHVQLSDPQARRKEVALCVRIRYVFVPHRAAQGHAGLQFAKHLRPRLLIIAACLHRRSCCSFVDCLSACVSRRRACHATWVRRNGRTQRCSSCAAAVWAGRRSGSSSSWTSRARQPARNAAQAAEGARQEVACDIIGEKSIGLNPFMYITTANDMQRLPAQ